MEVCPSQLGGLSQTPFPVSGVESRSLKLAISLNFNVVVFFHKEEISDPTQITMLIVLQEDRPGEAGCPGLPL